jgi:hypothetical protein
MDPKLATSVTLVSVAECCSHPVTGLSGNSVMTLLLALRLLFVLSLSLEIILQPLQLFAETNLFKAMLCVHPPVGLLQTFHHI